MRRFLITDHAVDRYQERVDPALTLAQARERLEELCAEMRPHGHNARGERLYLARGIVLLVKHDRDGHRAVVSCYGERPDEEEGSPCD